jgi:hypothetical protein
MFILQNTLPPLLTYLCKFHRKPPRRVTWPSNVFLLPFLIELAGKRHHRSSRKVQLAATDTSPLAAIFRDPLAIWVCRSLPPSWRRSLPPSGRCLPRLGGHSSPSSDRHNMSRLARHNAPPPLCAAVPPEDLTSSPNACLEEELQATSSYRICMTYTEEILK